MLFRRVNGVKKKALFGKVSVACWQKQDVLRAPSDTLTHFERPENKGTVPLFQGDSPLFSRLHL